MVAAAGMQRPFYVRGIYRKWLAAGSVFLLFQLLAFAFRIFLKDLFKLSRLVQGVGLILPDMLLLVILLILCGRLGALWAACRKQRAAR